jgi:hypothetical protein
VLEFDAAVEREIIFEVAGCPAALRSSPERRDAIDELGL